MSLPQAANEFLSCLVREGRDKASYSFHFVAVRQGDNLMLIQGRVRTDAPFELIGVDPLLSKRVVAASYRLSDLSVDVEGFIRGLTNEGVSTPVGIVQLPKPEGGSHIVIHNPEDDRGGQRRWHCLIIKGQAPGISLQNAEWDLRGGGRPFANFRDLMDSFGAGPQQEVVGICEILAENVVAIAPDSTVADGKAQVGLYCSDTIDLGKVSASFIVYHNGRVVHRFELNGLDFMWDRQHDFLKGKIEFEVPTPSAVLCTACCEKVAQHYYWIDDPRHTLNDRRSAFLVLDDELSFISSAIERDFGQSSSRDARDFEQVVSWIFWMSGFSVASLGTMQKSEFQSWADLLIVVPGAIDYMVVECTTGNLKPETKGANLFRRAAQMREKLATARSQPGRVLPLMVSNRPKAELTTEIDLLARNGVAVLAREDLQRLLSRTILVPNPGEVFAALMASVENGE